MKRDDIGPLSPFRLLAADPAGQGEEKRPERVHHDHGSVILGSRKALRWRLATQRSIRTSRQAPLPPGWATADQPLRADWPRASCAWTAYALTFQALAKFFEESTGPCRFRERPIDACSEGR